MKVPIAETPKDQTQASTVTQAVAVRFLTQCATAGTPNIFKFFKVFALKYFYNFEVFEY